MTPKQKTILAWVGGAVVVVFLLSLVTSRRRKVSAGEAWTESPQPPASVNVSLVDNEAHTATMGCAPLVCSSRRRLRRTYPSDLAAADYTTVRTGIQLSARAGIEA